MVSIYTEIIKFSNYLINKSNKNMEDIRKNVCGEDVSSCFTEEYFRRNNFKDKVYL
jgi:hypothetical protein